MFLFGLNGPTGPVFSSDFKYHSCTHLYLIELFVLGAFFSSLTQSSRPVTLSTDPTL